MGKLTTKGVAGLRQSGRYADGEGLYLVIDAGGRRYWCLRYMKAGRRRDMSLGRADRIALADARERAAEARRKLAEGIDPIDERRRQQLGVVTFAEAARRLHGLSKEGWKNGKHCDQWLRTLELYAFPAMGDIPVGQVSRADVVRALEPIWLARPETARRVKQRIGVVIDWAVGAGLRDEGIEMRLVNRALPRHRDEPQHMRALPAREVPGFMRVLRLSPAGPTVRSALEILILTASRPGNVRRMRWEQVDLDRAVWNRPGTEMKTGKPHAVPLQARAVSLLSDMKARADTYEPLVFPGTSRDGMLSENTLRKAILDLGIEATAHGFRTSFKEWSLAAGWPDHLSEAQLAHSEPNKARAAYAREDLLEERRPMMEAWAAFLASGTSKGHRAGRRVPQPRSPGKVVRMPARAP